MVRPLDYETPLNLGEAKERLEEIEKAFEKVKGNYPGLSRSKGDLSPEDKKTLNECIGVLLPLSFKKSVQEEVGSKLCESRNETVHYRSGKLQQEILFYMSKFKNTGVTLLK